MKSEKLRILVLNYEFPPLGGGASPVSYEISKGYAKLGHKVDVVTMHYRGLPYFEKRDGMNIYRVPCWRSKKEICHPWEQLTYIWSAKRFLRNHLKTKSYDVCHTHFIIPTGIISLWLKRKYNIPYIITSHGSDVLGYNKRFRLLYPLLANKWKEIIREAKMVITPSKFLLSEIKKITSDGKFDVIPNGIDPKKFKPMKKENRILVVARLFPNKGVQDIIDALNEDTLKDKLRKGKWEVDIVGDGPYKNFLENKSKKNNLSDMVSFHGWVDNNSKEMREFYGHAKIFISASYFENMSMVILEALASGCKIIASNVGGNPEIVKKEGLFEQGDIAMLGKRIKEAIDFKKSRIFSNKVVDYNKISKKYARLLTL